MMIDKERTALAGAGTRISGLLGRMTLEEKAALTVGRDTWTTQPIERLGIPSVWLSDGPTGLRKARSATEVGLGDSVPATCFPTACGLAASWDVGLVAEVGRAIGIEAQAQEVQVVLAPGVNLKRSPMGGRNFEYFSEDPVLSGELAAAFIDGLQEQGVGASLKHLVANEQETHRMYADSVLDERTLRELYLRPFEIAVATARPWTLMAAYNRLNGIYCTEHRHLLHDIVVEEWGYEGIVMSDWLAVNDRAAGIEAGLHLQMPGGPTAEAVVAAVRDGRLAETRLDEIVRALLAFILRADAARKPDTPVDLEAHHRLARRASGASIVLLKNEGDLLPLAGEARTEIALIGAFAREPRYQGAGSSQVAPARPVETLHDELVALLGAEGRVSYAPGYGTADAPDSSLLQEAQTIARRASVAVVVVGLPGSYETEGADRTHLDLPPAHTALVEAALAVQPRTAVVLINGSAVAMPWATRVPAIVEGWLGGQAGGGALADVLLGRVNPSGKLAETFPVRLQDTPAYLSFPDDATAQVPFAEGLFTGYRWYDARQIEPLFPFGHGLSYTSFAYADLAVDKSVLAGTETLTVTLRVRNTGTRDGQEVVQLYVREQRPRLRRPDKELKAFTKVSLAPGEETEVRFQLDARAFAVYDPRPGAWVTTSGLFDLLVGASSRDIRLRASVQLEATHALPVRLDRLSPLRDWLDHPATRARLQPLLAAFLGRLFGSDAAATGEGEGGTDDPLLASLYDMPISKLVLFGVLGEQELARLIEAASSGGAMPGASGSDAERADMRED
jgi:beta-glucosidase